MARAQAPRAVRTPSAAAQRPPAPFLAEKLKTPKNSTMPKRGKRSAASKKNGALGGRSSGPAGGHPTADAPQGAAALVAPSKKEADRPRNTPSAVPLVRRDPDRICLEEAALFGHGERALLLSSMPFSLCLLFMHQASRAGKQDLVCFQCNAFCLKREQVKQLFVFLNTIFLSKRNIGVVGT